MIKCRIMLVDDDLNLIQSFKFPFKANFKKEEFELITFSNPLEAEKYLKENDTSDIAVIISDQRMKEEKGTKFLENSLIYAPDAVRIIATGYADSEDNIHTTSINNSKVWHFFNKPWNEKELVKTIRASVIQYMRNTGKVFEDGDFVAKWIESGEI